MQKRFRRALQVAVASLVTGIAPARAAQAEPDHGTGYYDGFGLDGPARAAVRQWLHDTVVACDRLDAHGAKSCRLDGVTSSLRVEYVGPPYDPQRTAVAFVSYSPDTGNMFHGVTGVWHRQGGAYEGGRFMISDDVPSGELREADGGVSYEVEASRFMPAVEPRIRYRLRLVDDGRRLRAEQVGPRRTIAEVPPVSLPATEPTPITTDVNTQGAEEPVRRLLDLGDGAEDVFYPRRGQPDRMRDFFGRDLVQAWNEAAPAMRAEPVLDGNPLTGTQDTDHLRLLSLALGYHEGRMATIVATVRARVGGKDRIFPIDFNVVDEDGSWRIGNVKWREHGPFLFTTLRDIADRWKRDHGPAPRAVAMADAAGMNLADAGMSLTEPRYRGEWGITFDHNGSEVAAFPRAGLIAYVKPKAGLAFTVRPGDVVYRGNLASSRISGTAYVFKAGCAPAPYHVEGAWARPGAIDFGIVLRGRSPVRRERGNCDVTGYSATSHNAVLRFDSVLDKNG